MGDSTSGSGPLLLVILLAVMHSAGCRYCHAWGHMLKDYAKKKQADLRRQQSASAAAATPSAGSNTIETLWHSSFNRREWNWQNQLPLADSPQYARSKHKVRRRPNASIISPFRERSLSSYSVGEEA